VFCRHEVVFDQLNVAEVNQVAWSTFRSSSKRNMCLRYSGKVCV